MFLRFVVAAALTLLPIYVLLRFFYTRDVHREPRSVLIGTFVRGVLIIVPILLLGVILSLLWTASWGPWGNALFLSFILAALPEELSKLWVIAGYSAGQNCFDEPMDGLVYGATAALGFAALENALYVFSGGWPVALTRAFTAVPMHAITGAILGYGVSRARFDPGKPGGRIPAVLAAILVHGGYNTFLFAADYTATEGTASVSRLLSLIAGAGGILLIAAIWTLRTVRRLRREQLS